MLRQRGPFVQKFWEEWKRWNEIEVMKTADTRARGVHGLAFCAFTAMNALVVGFPADDMAKFEEFAVGYTTRAVVDVREEVNVNVWWTQVMDAWRIGCFGHGKSLRDYFRVYEVSTGTPPNAPNQHPSVAGFEFLKPWISYRIYIEPETLMAQLAKEYLAKVRANMPLSRRDLRDQLSKHAYWVPGEHKQRYGESRIGQRAWCIEVDRHPLGYVPTTDEELLAAYQRSVEKCGGLGEFHDPRKGPLFLLIEDYERMSSEAAL